MSFLRNRDIKRFILLMCGISAVIITAGFIADIQAGIFASLSCLILCISFLIFTCYRYKIIADMSEQIDIILHGNDYFNFNIYNEGELYILQSEIQKMIIRLREQTDMLKKDKNYLSDSMADIAHQLRTPLTSINMIAAFLRNPDLDYSRRIKLVRELESLLSRIDWLIKALLKISKIDAGTAVFQKETVSVKLLIENSISPLAIALELKGINLSVSGDDSVNFTGDLNWSSEAIGNIIKNCIEHTESGGKIQIEYSENAIFTEIIIKDDGSGIDKEDLPNIFERFYQGKNSSDSSFGVGLALCRMILSMQNATIKAANNTDGKGTIFIIKFFKQIL